MTGRPPRRHLWLGLLLAALATLAVVASRSPNSADAQSAPPSEASIQALQDRIDRADLDRLGIFVAETGPVGTGRTRCVQVQLLNPSRPNVRYLRQEFGPAVCVDPRPQGGYVSSAVGCGAGPANGSTVTVPDVRGLAPYVAVRRLTAAGLQTCNAPAPKPPSRFAAENALRVTSQCPAAGALVPAPAIVGFRSAGLLPGGYAIRERAEGDLPCR